jgi:hypothetical protein
MPESIARHDADGQPYVAYYRNDAVTGFIWSGRVKDPVQVTREMGEPIIDTFLLTGGGGFVALPEFKRQCDRYLDRDAQDLDEYTHPDGEPLDAETNPFREDQT